MKIQISPWINTKTYYLEKISSVSFVEDIKKRIFYLLKGKISDLWDMIVKTQNYDSLLLWALENDMENQLNDFIAELQQKKLIQTDIKFQAPINKFLPVPIKKDIKNYIFFEKIQSKLAANNNLLSTLYLILNYKCNLNCRHCCNPQNMNNFEITFEDAKKIIDEAIDIGINEICLTGGECSINKDFLKIAQYIRQKYLKLYIFTNGQKFYDDEKLLNQIVQIYPNTVQISLYSMIPNIHDNITMVKGSYNKTINIIKKLREKNINVLVSCFQMSYNFGHDKYVEKFAKSVGAQFLSGCTFINNINNNNASAKLCINNIEQYYRNNINIKKPRNTFERNEELICSAGVDKICISPNLDINPCIYFNYVLGNFNSVSLKEIKNIIIPQFHKKFITKNLKECFNHDYCAYCSYCPTYSCNEGNTFLNKSSILCEDAKAYKKAFENLNTDNLHNQ